MKRSLNELYIPDNPNIDDDAIYALILLVQASPELIVDPSLCTSQPSLGLEYNMVQYAARNPDVAISGTRMEMAWRLADILRTREINL
jgi:hypothetical protein